MFAFTPGHGGRAGVRLAGKIARRLLRRTQILQAILPRITDVGEGTPYSRQRALNLSSVTMSLCDPRNNPDPLVK